MAPDDAAFALHPWIKPKRVILMHYNSNLMTKGALVELQEAMKGSLIKLIPMTEGQTTEI